jgi:hypothetical protein
VFLFVGKKNSYISAQLYLCLEKNSTKAVHPPRSRFTTGRRQAKPPAAGLPASSPTTTSSGSTTCSASSGTPTRTPALLPTTRSSSSRPPGTGTCSPPRTRRGPRRGRPRSSNPLGCRRRGRRSRSRSHSRDLRSCWCRGGPLPRRWGRRWGLGQRGRRATRRGGRLLGTPEEEGGTPPP